MKKISVVACIVLCSFVGVAGAAQKEKPTPASTQSDVAPDTVPIKKTELQALQERSLRIPEMEALIRQLQERLVIAESANAKMASDIVSIRLRIAQAQQSRATEDTNAKTAPSAPK